jgi:hypothetical protein
MRHFFSAACALVAIGLLSAAGCSGNKDASKPIVKGKGTEHAHPDKGPHGGPLAEWGDEDFHVEYVFDRDKKQVTYYILDGEAAKAMPVEAESVTLVLTHVTPQVDVTLKPEPEKADPEGKSSRFVGTHDALGEKGPFKGLIRGKIAGKKEPYEDMFTEKAADAKKK